MFRNVAYIFFDTEFISVLLSNNIKGVVVKILEAVSIFHGHF